VSDIKGEGYGSKHGWKRDITGTWEGEKGTRYFCSNCKAVFIHFYDCIPEIFEAMKFEEIPENCDEIK